MYSSKTELRHEPGGLPPCDQRSTWQWCFHRAPSLPSLRNGLRECLCERTAAPRESTVTWPPAVIENKTKTHWQRHNNTEDRVWRATFSCNELYRVTINQLRQRVSPALPANNATGWSVTTELKQTVWDMESLWQDLSHIPCRFDHYYGRGRALLFRSQEIIKSSSFLH